MFKTIKVLTKTHKKIYLFIIVSLLEAFQKGKGCEKRMSQKVTLNFDGVLFMFNCLKKINKRNKCFDFNEILKTRVLNCDFLMIWEKKSDLKLKKCLSQFFLSVL